MFTFLVIRMGFMKQTMKTLWNNPGFKYHLQTYKLSDTKNFGLFFTIYIELTIQPMENKKPESVLSLFCLKNFFMSIH